MRVQSAFEKFSQANHGGIFMGCFIGLRVILGLSGIYFGHLVELELANTETVATESVTLVTLVMVVVGAMFVAGLLTRPIALAGIVVAILAGSTKLEIATDPHLLLPLAGLVLLLGIFAAGGAGHVFGLDGIIYRNIRRPNPLTKFLFG